MNLVINHSALLLDRWQTVELIDAAGATTALDNGCVWITMDGDRRDIVLGAGDTWTVEKNGRTLLHAEAPSTLRITGPAVRPRQAALPRALAAFAGWMEQAFRRRSAPYF